MSLKVAVICEDHTNDQYIVEPVLKALLQHLGKPRARIQLVMNPRIQGLASLIGHLCDLIARYSAIADIVIVAVDSDCEDGRLGHGDRVRQMRNRVANCSDGSDRTLVVVAQQEVEVWALWGQRNSIESEWSAVRAECDPKERYFDTFITRDDLRVAGAGRTRLIEASLARGWVSLTQGCPELGDLERELRALL
jgi:hypothetical protein